MNTIFSLAERFVVTGMAGSRSGYHLTSLRIALMAMSVVLVGSGLMFTLYAEYMWLQAAMSPPAAALTTAVSAYLLATVLLSAFFLIESRQRESASDDISKALTQAVNSFSSELQEPVRDNPKTSLMLASLAGFVAGEQRV